MAEEMWRHQALAPYATLPWRSKGRYHREEGEKALASAVALAGKASVPAKTHVGVGRQGDIVADFVRKLGAGLVVMGTRGHTGLAGVLLGSVAQDVIAHSEVPVTLVK